MSSANFHKSEELPGIAKSLIIAKNSQGPILVPCGIPLLKSSMATVLGKGVTLTNFHACGTLDFRKDALIKLVTAGITYTRIFLKRN